MRILLTGLSHKTASINVREKVSLTNDVLPRALKIFSNYTLQGVIVATCNRTEIYSVATNAEHGIKAHRDFLQQFFEIEIDNFKQNLYVLEQEKAVTHLFRVASSLDSQIIGESEILGQIRDSFSAAAKEGIAGGTIAHLFHSAIRTGKRARTETSISRNALSVSRACVQLSKQYIGQLDQVKALIIGVGEASRLAAQALRDSGSQQITITNRTITNAQDLANEVNAEIASFDHLSSLLIQSDIVVTATGAPEHIISKSQLSEIMDNRQQRPLLIMDIAAPRDVEYGAKDIPGVKIFTLDDLETIATNNRIEREAEAAKVELIIDEEVESFKNWWKSRLVTPTISAIHDFAENIRAEEISKTLNQISTSSSEDIEKIDKMTKAIIKKLLHAPTASLRSKNDASFTQYARELFGLKE
tara:strand:+ start:2753 stop:4000 length:1248 start_codon:yes stop_codon:yes gene_type:complete